MEPTQLTQHPNPRTRNIIIFGEKGVGKTSLIAMLTGKEDEVLQQNKTTENGFEFSRTSHQGTTYYEVVGVNSPGGLTWAKNTISNLLTLMQSLSQDGVVLLIHVIVKGRITSGMEDNYNLFVNQVFLSGVPVLAIITHCEIEERMGNWWKENASLFCKQYGMRYQGAISTCLKPPGQDDDVHPMFRKLMQKSYEKSLSRVPIAIKESMLAVEWNIDSWGPWIQAVCCSTINILGYLNPLPNLGLVDLFYSLLPVVDCDDGDNCLEWDEAELVESLEDDEFLMK